MIFQLFLLFGQQATTAEQVIERFAAAHRTPPKFEAVISAKANGGGPVNTKLLLDGLSRAWFRATVPMSTYTASIGREWTRELESSSKLYDDAQTIRLAIANSRISGLSEFFPHWVRHDDLNDFLPEAKWEFKGSETINGFGCDKLFARKVMEQQGIEIWLAVDQAGNLINVRIKMWDPERKSDREWTVTSLKMRSSFALNELEAPVPAGYMPLALDSRSMSLGMGDQFPMTGWTSGSSAVSIQKGKPSLIAILGADCDASKRALPWLMNFASKVPITYVSDRSTPSLVRGALTNPKGDLLQKIGYPATPFFAWLDASGKISGLWMGFDPASAAQLEKDILAKASGAE